MGLLKFVALKSERILMKFGIDVVFNLRGRSRWRELVNKNGKTTQ